MSKHLPVKNQAVIASAGSGKTSGIVEKAIGLAGKRILITTYTTENLEQIKDFLADKYGCIPSQITVVSWYSFLLQDGVRPYQSYVTSAHRRANTIHFEDLTRNSRFTAKVKADDFS